MATMMKLADIRRALPLMVSATATIPAAAPSTATNVFAVVRLAEHVTASWLRDHGKTSVWLRKSAPCRSSRDSYRSESTLALHRGSATPSFIPSVSPSISPPGQEGRHLNEGWGHRPKVLYVLDVRRAMKGFRHRPTSNEIAWLQIP